MAVEKSDIALASFLLSLLMAMIGGIAWIGREFAQRDDVMREVLDARFDALEGDIDDDAARAAHYRRLKDERPLSPAEAQRYEWLVEQMERKYKKAEAIEAEQRILSR